MNTFPTLFVSHGAPTFALHPGIAGPRLHALAQSLPRPEAVAIISPHWQTPGLKVTTAEHLTTIHDFGGFDPALYDIQYPATGHPALAARAIDRFREAGWDAEADTRRGLDHGAWVPLRHMYPEADVPVFQISLPDRLDAASAYAFGQALAPLSEEGVLIVGSGSLTHNLYEFRLGDDEEADYAREFTEWIREAVREGDHDRLVDALDAAPHAKRAHPTSEHFLPLLIAAGAANDRQPGRVIEGGITHGVLAMDAFVFGEETV